MHDSMNQKKLNGWTFDIDQKGKTDYAVNRNLVGSKETTTCCVAGNVTSMQILYLAYINNIMEKNT